MAQRMKAPVLYASRLAGRLHRGQKVPIAQVLAGLGRGHVGAARDLLGLEVLDSFYGSAVRGIVHLPDSVFVVR